MKYAIWWAILFCPTLLAAQFPPAAGLPGSTAIAADSAVFRSWAMEGVLDRGLQSLADTSLGLAETGMLVDAFGEPDLSVLSLGDGGQIILRFDPPIADGDGFDFAVFENGFASGDGYFLELAFVEASSDGIHFVRFPAQSLTDTSEQVGGFGLLQPEKLNNLAGKYVGRFGTPFDVSELPMDPNLDTESITHLRIIDVVGSLDSNLVRKDAEGRPVNDPWPTPFPSSGFDLDAVGVIHEGISTSVFVPRKKELGFFPNPVRRGSVLQISGDNPDWVQIYSVDGRLYFRGKEVSQISVSDWSPGIYWIRFGSGEPKKLIVIP